MNDNRLKAKQETHERDGWKCVNCGIAGDSDSLSAHHLIERKLWTEEDNWGYLLDNLVSVCEPCHRLAEQTVLSVETLRQKAGIAHIVVPEHIYADEVIDKWGNTILPNGMRTKGEMFDEPSVQENLREGGVLDLFTKYVKYPRTYHFGFSPGRMMRSERVIADCSQFEGQEVAVFLKLDGENSTLYNDYFHARSISGTPHPSRDYAKSIWAKMKYDIPEGWRVSCENLYAKHSIHYHNLGSYLYMFAIWNDKNFALSHDDKILWAELLGLPLSPVIYRGPWNEEKIHKLADELVRTGYEGDEAEGIVVWNTKEFHYRDFRRNVAKYVKGGWSESIQHGGHWRNGPIVANELRR